MPGPVADWIVEAYSAPDPKPFLFRIGQTVRLKKGRSRDGQTPEYWDGAKVVVEQRYSTGLLKIHRYILRHVDRNLTADFEEEDIDGRYAVKNS